MAWSLLQFWVTLFVSAITINRCTTKPVLSSQQDFQVVHPQIFDLEHNGFIPQTETLTARTPTRSRPKRLHGGSGKTAVSHNALANYDFEYQIHGGGNFFGHTEKRDGVETKGEYFVLLPDSRRQVVKYYVDSTGYHATVTYEPILIESYGANPEKTINPITTSILHSPTNSSSPRKSYKKIVRKRVPKRRRSSSGVSENQQRSQKPTNSFRNAPSESLLGTFFEMNRLS